MYAGKHGSIKVGQQKYRNIYNNNTQLQDVVIKSGCMSVCRILLKTLCQISPC